MIGIYTDSITRAGGISSNDDVRIREAIDRNLRIDTPESPADSGKWVHKQDRTAPGKSWWTVGFFQLSTNRFLI